MTMDTRESYNEWAQQYDTNVNRTRDMEAGALKECLGGIIFDNCLEIGCGTGKNSSWLVERCRKLVAVDFSEEMLAKAREKSYPRTVHFIQADINLEWDFTSEIFELVTFSLVLEHIEDLDAIFSRCKTVLAPGGYIYIGELHPFKQYTGSKARYPTAAGKQEVPCFTHHISDYIQLAGKYGFKLLELREYFDEGAGTGIPRILSMVLQKS